MRYCKKCIQPDTRPQIEFDEEGVCPACRYSESLPRVNWKRRKRELLDFVEPYRSENGSYDCIVGVSGGKDSTRQALYVRNVLGMNPLLVSLTYSPEQQTTRGAANIENMVNQGFDLVTVGVAPTTWKKLVRKGFFEYGNWARSTELALFSSVPRLAIAYQINLVMWGENPMLTLGEVSNQGKNAGGIIESTIGGNTLGGGDISWLVDSDTQEKHLLQYKFPSKQSIDRAGLRFIYLGYYWKEWSKVFNASFSGSRGLDVRDVHPKYFGDDLGVDALDDDWVSLNQMLKYLKYGFGKVTDNVNEQIRNGTMTKDRAAEIARKYDGKCDDEIIRSFCRYIDISEKEFWAVVDRYVNQDLFEKIDHKTWAPKFEIQL